MKKSEALEKLKKQLWLLGVPDLSDYDAESLLRFVEEELDMSPPFCQFLDNSDPENMEYKCLAVWEPEDD